MERNTLSTDVGAAVCGATFPSETVSTVEVGDQRGRLLGFPTANLHPTDLDEIDQGVYAAIACAEDGTWWSSAVNVGTRPTFTGGGVRPSVEVHLIGFDGDLYGQRMTVRFVERLRDEVRFESVDALIEQLRADVAAAAATIAARRLIDEPTERDQRDRSSRRRTLPPR